MISKWEDYVSEHQAYQTNFNSCSKWLNDLNLRLNQCSDTSGDKHIIEDRQARIQELLVEKEQGAAQVHQTIELGEKLYPNTATEGREIVRQELRSLREKWETFSNQLSDTQRHLEVCLLQWSSYDESFEQFQAWLNEAAAKMQKGSELKGTLQEKKVQLQSHKVHHQDILSHQHMLDGLSERVLSLSQTSSDSRVSRLLADITKQYEAVCDQSQQLLQQYETNVAQHQDYQDASQQIQEVLITNKEKLIACADVTGDRYALQNKLDRLAVSILVIFS